MAFARWPYQRLFCPRTVEGSVAMVDAPSTTVITFHTLRHTALSRMIAADPSLRLLSDGDTGQTLLAGMGQLHLDIAVERLAGEHHVHVTTGRPVPIESSTVNCHTPAIFAGAAPMRAIDTQESAMMRASRPIMTLRMPAMPVSRNTGASASWIA